MRNKSKELLDLALNDKLRQENDLCLIFVTKDKYPAFNDWQNYAKDNQSENDINRLYRKLGTKATGYSYFTGIGGLIDIDFDWEWTYHVALRHFGDRMNTRTIKTPNGGYRALFLVDEPRDFLDFKSRPPRVEIHGNKTHHVVVGGQALDNEGQLKEYKAVNDLDIRKDNDIIQDFEEFLTKINENCKFLEYECIADKIKDKSNYLTQEQRTSIGSFFAAEKIDIDTATDFFRMCEDFDPEITGDHLKRLYNKDFKHPTCETLRENFNWNLNRCKRCKRKSENNEITSESSKNPEFDIRKLNESQIFNLTEKNGVYCFPKSVLATPIFELDSQIFYVTVLNTLPTENGEKKIIGIYGSKSGYGSEPMSFILENNGASSEATISDINKLRDENQQSTLTNCIIKSINSAKNLEETSESVFSETSINEGDIVREIISKLKYFIHLDDELQYYIITSWVLGTYMFPLFSTYGYLIISGEKGAGKGTLLDLLGKLCWNSSKKLISPSEATLFRLIKEQMPTMIIDEYHRAIKNPSTSNAIIAILEAGYEKEGVVPRSELQDGKKWVIVDYPVYSPKALGTREDVEADDKAIKIILTKLVGDTKYAKRKKEIPNHPFFEDAREFIMNWTIKNQKEVMNAYDEIEPSDILNGREFNVWLPVIAISKTAFPEKFEEIRQFIESSVAKNQSNYSEKEMKVLRALEILYPYLEDGGRKLKNSSFKVTNKEIKYALKDIGEDIAHQSIKSSLENLKLVGYHKSGTYYLEQKKLEDTLQKRGFNINVYNEVLSEEPIWIDEINAEVFCRIYSLLLEYTMDENEFTKQYAEISNENFAKASELVNILFKGGYIDTSPEGKLEPSDKLRERVEILMADKGSKQTKICKNEAKSVT